MKLKCLRVHKGCRVMVVRKEIVDRLLENLFIFDSLSLRKSKGFFVNMDGK